MNGILIGEKLGHSFSADIHKKLGVNYSLQELKSEQLKGFVENCLANYFNVTIPYKKQIIPYLDIVDESAKKIGAVNTVVIKDGKKCGYNTDYMGFKSLIEKNNIPIKNKSVLILGTGGTKNTVQAVVTDLGAKIVRVVSRNGEINYSNCYFNDVNVIINTTPVGMYPNNDDISLDLKKFTNLQAVVDCVYNPINTKFVLQAKSLGIKACGGLYMLVAQAVWAYSLVNEVDFSVTDKIYNELLLNKTNIALVGMPSCGKTTIGKILAEKCGKTFVDTDLEIVKTYGDIPSIFSSLGEVGFRDIESKTICNVAKEGSQVISTGGGAILREQNVIALKQNSIIVYVDRDLDLLSTEGRPLSKDRKTLQEMKKIREPIYLKVSDIVVKNNKAPEQVAEEILKEVLSVTCN